MTVPSGDGTVIVNLLNQVESKTVSEGGMMALVFQANQASMQGSVGVDDQTTLLNIGVKGSIASLQYKAESLTNSLVRLFFSDK